MRYFLPRAPYYFEGKKCYLIFGNYSYLVVQSYRTISFYRAI